jgi:hypothetical protein
MIRDPAEAEAAVRRILAEIDEHRWRDLVVPHGFRLEDITVEEELNTFEPSVPSRWRVELELTVPVIYTPDASRIPIRASLPARRDNLAALRDWITIKAKSAWIGRMELRAWNVTPDEAPPPYLENGQPNGPPADWSVAAAVDIG